MPIQHLIAVFGGVCLLAHHSASITPSANEKVSYLPCLRASPRVNLKLTLYIIIWRVIYVKIVVYIFLLSNKFSISCTLS
jgi:hypothetical protein